MTTLIAITFMLISIDVLLLFFLPKWYTAFGIPYHIQKILRPAGKDKEGIFLSTEAMLESRYKVQIADGVLGFRSKFSLDNMYSSIGLLSFIKGQLKTVDEGLELRIVANNTSLLLLIFLGLLPLFYNLDQIGMAFLIIFIAIVIATTIYNYFSSKKLVAKIIALAEK